MFRFIFGLSLLFVSALASAGNTYFGPYNTEAEAKAACQAASNTGSCNRISWEGELRWYYNHDGESYLYNWSVCTDPYVPDESGLCVIPDLCDVEPDHPACVNDDYGDLGDFDETANTGGTDNEFGGDGGSECNFAPEGCAPGDKPNLPDLADLDPPDPDAPLPPDAVTTGEKTETNADGSSTTTSTREWQETDGSTVKETIKETINPDGSKTTEKVIQRDSPDGSSTSTTVRSDTDTEGNVTISGTTEEKQAEKEGTASGGGTCDSPPSCNGDAIQCAILQQQWLTRCDKNSEYSDSNCTAQPLCKGDPLMCASLINEWQNRCAMAKAPSDADSEFKDRGFKTAEQVADSGGVFGDAEEVSVAGVTSSVLSSRSAIVGSCPAPKSVDVGPFGNFEITFQAFCDLADMIYWLVMLSAYMTATFIIFRSVTN